MHNLKKMALLCGILFTFHTGLVFSANDINPEVVKNILAAVKGQIQNVEDVEIRKTAIPDIYEVSLGQTYFYFTHDGQHFFAGDLIDIKNQINLSEESRKKKRKITISDLNNKKKTIVFKSAKEKTQVTVFTDIDCTYCRRLHQEIPAINNGGITVNYIFFPRAGFPSGSYDKALKVWCAKDQNKAMTEAKLNGDIQGKLCADDTIKEHLAVVKQLNIRSTPFLILNDGSTVRGYVPAARLKAIVEQIGDR